METKDHIIFFCLLMTLQLLPVAQIGMMLSQNQWTEELPHSSAETGKTDTSINNSPFLPPLTNHYISAFEEYMALAYIHTSASIPSNHSTDIVTPPPDFLNS